jgi:hypothetical protein
VHHYIGLNEAARLALLERENDGGCESGATRSQQELPQKTGEGGMTLLLASIRIVTNAHVVRKASTVRARASFGPHVVNCKVEWLSLPLDLALLKIPSGDWDDFWKGWGIADVIVVEEGGYNNTNVSERRTNEHDVRGWPVSDHLVTASGGMLALLMEQRGDGGMSQAAPECPNATDIGHLWRFVTDQR